ncbi:hypothetical protein vseg_001261 [Gypsophila vaccaria]
MVSKRQRAAQKKYKEQHPELFPKHEPTPPKDPSKKKTKKKKPQFKRKNIHNKPTKSSFSKHPLRIPGLKPGDSCYICKDLAHIAKDCPHKAEWDKNKICLFCRQRGHSMKNCNNKSEEVVEQKLCYNCGENGHSLSRCPHPMQDGGTKFALCFICKERGHLSKDCPKNTHGIYPKGGCCKICSGINHLARDCPNKGASGSFYDRGRESAFQQDQPRPKVTKLFSGDDLEDDFMIEADDIGKNDSKKITDVLTPETNHTDTKVKKKQGTKVVNFVG